MTARVRNRTPAESRTRAWPLKACLLATALPAAEASACAVCAQAMPTRTLNAYLGVTLALSLLPIALSALVFLALRRQPSPSPGEDGGRAAEPAGV